MRVAVEPQPAQEAIELDEASNRHLVDLVTER